MERSIDIYIFFFLVQRDSPLIKRKLEKVTCGESGDEWASIDFEERVEGMEARTQRSSTVVKRAGTLHDSR